MESGPIRVPPDPVLSLFPLVFSQNPLRRSAALLPDVFKLFLMFCKKKSDKEKDVKKNLFFLKVVMKINVY